MNANAATLAGLLEAAQKITQTLADDLKADAELIRAGHGPDGISLTDVGNFTVGSLLPVEKAAADLLAILAAAKALRDLS